MKKIKNDSFMFLCVLLCFVHDMDTIWIDLIKYRSLNSVDLSLPFKGRGQSGTHGFDKFWKNLTLEVDISFREYHQSIWNVIFSL